MRPALLQAGTRCLNGDRHRWRHAGYSDEPHPRCDHPKLRVCAGCGVRVLTRCQRTARRKCEPCARSHRGRVRRIFASGWCDNPTQLVLLLTLTAPGDRLHHRKDGQVCACTPEDGIHLAKWNAEAGKRFNEVITYVRRWYGGAEYARGAEIQDGKRRQDGHGRGALHFHVLLRVGNPRQLLADYRRNDPDCRLRTLVIERGFGHSLDLKLAQPGHAWYCAKYVSKSADERATLPWADRRTGEISAGNNRYRPWSASRRWGLTMAQVRAEQAAWAQGHAANGNTPEKPQPARPAEAPGRPEGPPLDPNTHRYTDGPALSGLYDPDVPDPRWPAAFGRK